jgi:hypothetical protein
MLFVVDLIVISYERNEFTVKGNPNNRFMVLQAAHTIMIIAGIIGMSSEKKNENETAFLRSNPLYILPVMIIISFLGFQFFKSIGNIRMWIIANLFFLGINVLVALNRKDRVQFRSFEVTFSGWIVVFSSYIFQVFDFYIDKLGDLYALYLISFYLGTFLIIEGIPTQGHHRKRSSKRSS